ncbi:MAG: DUF61 family protein [Methanophagales archaeon ANME-1-THS]|nr:MAG: DUF61 family protein [Methanophagales archaeon ANME-1-THS]
MKGTFDEKLFVKVMKALNKHLPAERKTLFELLNEEKPVVQGRDQSIHRIKREELKELARLIPKEEYKNLKLPIYIELTPDYGRGIARIHGTLECEIVKRIVGDLKEQRSGMGEDRIRGDELFIYRADVRALRRKLPTTTEYAFFSTTAFQV